MDELKLFKLITMPDPEDSDVSYVSEYGWIDDKSFCVWVDYMWVDDFMRELKNIFGYGVFDDGAFNANMQSDGICIDLCEALGGYLNIEDVFPKEYYKH